MRTQGISRRALLQAAACLGAPIRPGWTTPGLDFSEIVRRAASLASQPFVAASLELPAPARGWSYVDYREIEFDPSRAVWRGENLRFELDALPRGGSYTRPVAINLVDGAGSRALAFDPSLFRRWPARTSPAQLGTLGFAGLRVRYPLIEGPPSHQECLVFLGASYFRGAGRGQVYGVSARGLAIDTATERPEEFPVFRDYWVVRPSAEAERITLFALLDGPSLTGAYEFHVEPGDDLRMVVTAEVFARQTVGKLGLCPLSSMHLFGKLGPPDFDDFRPEVHDSDGLLLHTGEGEWLWRPLDNASRLRISRFAGCRGPDGFGLLQRDRAHDHYQDLEALYHRRPSAWIEPRGPWPPGTLELVGFPSRHEHLDNVALLWACDRPLHRGETRRWAYELRFGGPGTDPSPQGRVVSTRTGRGRQARTRRFVIDFEGAGLHRLAPDSVHAVVTGPVPPGLPPVVEPTPAGLRAVFEVVGSTAPVELRCFLRSGGDAVSETWSYQWP